MAVQLTDVESGRDGPFEWLGHSEMACRVAEFDWSATSLGPISEWSFSLRSAAAICLHSRFQMAIYWGQDLICIYNDAEREVLGELHPDALGAPARQLLAESWETVGPQLRAVMRRRTSTWAVDTPLTLGRRGPSDVGYFTYSYSPILDDDAVVRGVLLVAEETTNRVLAERRVDGLRELALRSMDAARAAQRRVLIAADAERRRIERDLHDGAQQRLMAIRLELGLVDEIVEDDPQAAHAKLDAIRNDLDEALEEVRELAHGLYPPLLASDGLSAALSAAARRAAIPVTILGSEVGRAPRPVETAAYFCCLEGLQNAVKHAGPDARATISLRLNDGAFEFSIRDDGEGFDPDAAHRGHGLTNLRDRLAALGGQAEIISAPGEGTAILGQIPMT